MICVELNVESKYGDLVAFYVFKKTQTVSSFKGYHYCEEWSIGLSSGQMDEEILCC